MDQLDIPETPEQISKEWINHALGSSYANTSVKSLTIEPITEGAGLIGQLARISLDYSENKSHLPSTMMAKLSNPDPKTRATFHAGRAYEKEVRFYQELAKESEHILPGHYYSNIDLETGHSVILLEDLSAFRKVSSVQRCSRSDAKAVINRLAQLHSIWWQDSRLRSLSYITPCNHMSDYGQERFRERWEDLPDNLSKYFPKLRISKFLIELGRKYYSDYLNITKATDIEPITLIHKDAHLDNFLFSREDTERIVLLDWQTYGSGRSTFDISYFLIVSTDVEFRREFENELVNLYYDSLVSNGVTDYAFEQISEDYVKCFYRCLYILGVILAATDFTSAYGSSLFETIFQRVTAFAEDHESALPL